MEAVHLSNTSKYASIYSSLPDTLDEYSAAGVVGWSRACESVGVLGFVCIHGSVGCCLVYPGLHLHTLGPLLCSMQASFGFGHLELNEYNEHEVSEIRFKICQ